MTANNTNFFDVMVVLLVLTFILASFGGTAYLVQAHNWSPWWFLLTACMGVKVKTGSRK